MRRIKSSRGWSRDESKRGRGRKTDERLFCVLWGYSKATWLFDASHGAFLLDCVSLSEKKWEGGGGRIGDGTGRMSSSNIIKKRNGRTVKAVTDSGEWRQVWEWGRTGGRRHALGKHMTQGGGGRQNVFLLLPLFACLRFWGRPTPREKALPPNSVSCLCWNTVTSQNQESKTDDVYV